jgi:aconitate hydratase
MREQIRARIKYLQRLFAQSNGGEGGFGRPPASQAAHSDARSVRDGDIVIAAITSCSNTSNPGVMLAAGLVARKAVERGLKVQPWVKTSMTPGSRVVSAYLEQSGLQAFLDQLGFQAAGYGCATCMGNSGGLPEEIEGQIARDDLVVASVLSGNRNFEARIHPAVRANFLMSPPLVVAFAIAGRIGLDPETDPLGHDPQGRPVYLHELWPTPEEVATVMPFATDPANYRKVYAAGQSDNALWDALEAPKGPVFEWSERSSYLRSPPFLSDCEEIPKPLQPLRHARALVVVGNSVTTDHISPGGNIPAESDAGRYLRGLGVQVGDFNSYIARRAHDGVMARGTFANVRLKNLMVPGSEGGVTLHMPDGARMSIHEAATAYRREGVTSIVFAGEEYGTGSSRDWAAKGPSLLGVRAVIARSFERIHRSNLVGMGILPCQFIGDDSVQSLGIDGTESFELVGIQNGIRAQQQVTLVITRVDATQISVPLLVRVDTAIEEKYFEHGGILPFVLRKLMKRSQAHV